MSEAAIEQPMTAPAPDEKPMPSPSRALAILLCMIPILYCLSIVVYALLNFSAYGADVPRFVRYILAPGLIAAAFAAGATLLSPAKSAKLGLAASAALIALLIVEFVLNARLVFGMISLASNLGSGADAGDNVADGRSGIPPMFTSKQLSIEMQVDRLDQAMLGGIPGEEVLLCYHEGKPLFYTADRFGFNNDDSVHDAKLEVMIVGDSFVEGHCQPRPDTFTGKFRELRSQTAGIGMRGGGPLFELALIGRYGAQFEPDYVVMAFFEGNDWQNLRREYATPWLAEALSESARFGPTEPSAGQLAQADKVVEEWWSREISASDIFAKSAFARNIVGLNQIWGIVGLDYPKITREQPIYGEVLGKAKALTESWGGRFVLVYIPQESRYRGFLDKSFLYDDLRGFVLKAAASHNVEVVDLAEIFAEYDDPRSLFAPDGHFSAAGSVLAANALASRISSLEND